MLSITDLSFRHGERVLFDRASVAFSDGWKVGLVGRNGAGKSTLLRLIQGEYESDSGNINLMGRTRIGSVPQDPPGGDIAVIDAVLAADVERTALMAEADTSQDGLRLADIHMRLDEIDAASAPSRAASILNGLGFDNDAQQRPCGDLLRRLAHARGAGRHPVQQPRPPDPRRAVEPSRPRGDAVAHRASQEVPQHRADGQPRPRPAERRVRPHRAHRQREAGLLHRQLRFLREDARRASGQRCRPAGEARRPAQAHAGLRRPLQGQGQQGPPGAVAHEDDREAGSGRHRADRREDQLQLPLARAAGLADRDARRGVGRLSRRTAGAAQARPAHRHGRPHRAAGPERQRQVDLHPPDLAAARAARGQAEEDAQAQGRLLLAGPGRRPRLRGHAVRPHEHRHGPGRSRAQGPRPARPLRLLARPRQPQGRRHVGRREDPPVAGARHPQRAAPAAARRADQPSRHGCARLAGRCDQRLRGRRRAGEP